MKLYSPFKVAVDTGNLPLVLCSLFAYLAVGTFTLAALGKFMGVDGLIILLIVLAVIRTVYAMVKGK